MPKQRVRIKHTTAEPLYNDHLLKHRPAYNVQSIDSDVVLLGVNIEESNNNNNNNNGKYVFPISVRVIDFLV